MLRKLLFLSAAAAFGLAAPAGAMTVSDASGDILGTYTGTVNGDLDIVSASAAFDGSSFLLSAVLNGPVGTTPNVIYSWLIDRGGGTPRLLNFSPALGGSVTFDAVGVMFPTGGALAVVIGPGGPVGTFLPGATTVSGNTISAVFPLANFPTNGFDPANYRFTLLSRQRVVPGMDSGNFEIADFAPDTGSIGATVPEPASWAMMIAGFGIAGAAMRRRRATRLAAVG